jgi:hypothetical protein
MRDDHIVVYTEGKMAQADVINYAIAWATSFVYLKYRQ